VVVWAGKKADDPAPVATARTAMLADTEDEYRRLLYVAMTRAIDRLVVCGAAGKNALPPGCWWLLVSKALQPVAVEEADEDGKVWRYRKIPAVGGAATPVAERTAAPAASVPPWLERNAPAEPAGIRLLTPSAVDDADVVATAGPSGRHVDRQQARDRGVLVHRLLQSLPELPLAARADAARRHLARAAKHFSAEEREAMVEQVLRLLNDLRFADLFSPGSRAEVPIVGRLKDGAGIVSGQVDRLAVTRECVLIADYKSGRPAQHPPYIRQLALYRAVLAELYPDRIIRAALIWTDGPDLMEISAADLDRELAAVTST